MSTTYFDTREFQNSVGRILDTDPLLTSSITKWVERECKRRGVPFETIYESRWNTAGEPIGPRMEISHDAASLVLSVAEAMVSARDAEIDRLLTRHT